MAPRSCQSKALRVTASLALTSWSNSNGMAWTMPHDYQIDALETLGNPGLNWKSLRPFVSAMCCPLMVVALTSTHLSDAHVRDRHRAFSGPARCRSDLGLVLPRCGRAGPNGSRQHHVRLWLFSAFWSGVLIARHGHLQCSRPARNRRPRVRHSTGTAYRRRQLLRQPRGRQLDGSFATSRHPLGCAYVVASPERGRL